MKTIPTVEGKFYCVATSTSCEVTTEAGTLLGTAVAGQPLWFQAQKGDTTTLSDDNAEYSASRFNSAPQQQLAVIGVLGGDDGLPAGYTRLEYLESTGTQHIDTGYLIDNDSSFMVTCAIVSGISGAVFGAHWDQNGIERAGWSEYFAETPNRGWVFWGSLSSSIGMEVSNATRHTIELSQTGLYCNGKCLFDLSHIGEFKTNNTCWLFARNQEFTNASKYNGRIYEFTYKQNGIEILHFVPAIESRGVPCMFDLVTRTPFSNAGTGAFIAGIDSQKQLNKLLRRLPDRTGQEVGTLTVRLAVDLQTEKNRAAMDAMVAKNWEITEAA